MALGAARHLQNPMVDPYLTVRHRIAGINLRRPGQAVAPVHHDGREASSHGLLEALK